MSFESANGLPSTSHVYSRRGNGKGDLLYSIFSKYHMPQKLQHPPTLRITLFRIDNPFPKPLIIAQRPSQHLISRHRKLRAARRTHQRRRLRSITPGMRRPFRLRTRPREYIAPHFRRHMRVASVRFQAPRVPVAAQVRVAVFLDEGYSEGSQRVDVVV